ncbi:hypothetical protein [Polyangium sp. y55x31]|uniref:hypothetical protein n=1 Tax=Polyangium sp. y55x31 TaxID=3042688 RepID=UPI00248304B9|nr:hypothetical protein [Polyangium sp. y55x31]MDI1483632.1 hypothetical protein [Polyangium sp. y55x31]
MLEGLAARPELAELGEHARLASELLALARERGAGPERVLEALDAANEACTRLKVQTAAAKTSAVYKVVIEALQKGDVGCGGTS